MTVRTPHPDSKDQAQWLPRSGVRGLIAAALMVLILSACGSNSTRYGAPLPGEDVPVNTEPVTRERFVSDMTVAPEIMVGENVGFTPTEATTTTQNADGTMTIVGTVDVPTAGGPIPIEDAQVIVEPDPVTGEDRIVGGTGTVPFPRIGELADAVIHHLPTGIIGVAPGRDLHHLGAHLQDDREYLYFHFDGGLSVELPADERPGYDAVPVEIEVPVGKSATFVLDPTDPYFYIGGACPQSSNDPGNTADGDNAPNRNTGSADDSSQNDPDAIVSIQAGELPPGEDCGFGFSLNGNIPAPATAGGSTFTGHVVIDGVLPLYTGLELDGTTLVSYANGYRTVGWGTVVTSIPLLDSLVDVAIPLGNATAEVQVEGQRIGVAIEGQAGGSNKIVLPLDIPITLPSGADVDFVASYGYVPDAAGEAVLDPASRAEFRGTTQAGLGAYGDTIGLDLSDVATTESTLRIDTTGAHLTGRGQLSIHPSLSSDAVTVIEAFASGSDPAATYLTGTADVRVLGTNVSNAAVRVDRSGLSIAGRVNAGGIGVDVAGRVTDQAADLTGGFEVEALVGLGDVSDRTQPRLADALAEVERLNAEIDATRAVVVAERNERDEGLLAARRALDTAQSQLDRINDTIRSNNNRIDTLEDRKDDEKDRFDDLSLIQKGRQLVTHEARLAGWTAEIVALEASNVTQRGLKTAAEAAVRTAQDALTAAETALNSIPIDTDPRIIALLAARDVAQQALETVRAGVDAISQGGAVRGTIDVQVGTAGLAGSFSGQFCSNAGGCVDLGSGRVGFDPTTTVCVELPAVGEQCLPTRQI